jgi:Mrp family chromosome partitioning ATPase
VSIIEKALDKALGRTDDDAVAEDVQQAGASQAPEPDAQDALANEAAPPVPEPEAELAVASPQSAFVAENLAAQETRAPGQDSPIEEPGAGGAIHALDWELLKSHGYVSSMNSALFGTFERISRPVLANAFSGSRAGIQRGNLLLVTSSRAGEGKTFTALNLALSLTLADPAAKILLVDADTEKSSLSRLLGLADQSGLSELLESKNQRLQDLTRNTDLPGLRILPAGQSKQKGYGLLSGSAIMKFAKELAKLHPGLLVIFDAPPLLDVAETASLAMQVGQVLVVVEVEMTPQIVVREALAKLEFCNVVGCVLNKATQAQSAEDESLAFGYGLYQPELGED